MANAYVKLDQALKDLIEAYIELEEDIDERCGDDEDTFNNAIVEALETSVESAVDELGASTSLVATMLSSLTEALELLDPTSFEDDADVESFEMAEDSDYSDDE